ncbi:store-operated calcium entry regulator STIMATE-like, partial [Lingula anatina]|uniref:Store-operated calcium entry regulator STIMATE-like n=1 Tax=Lingula anatina TaxID=7574 RepID=A0A2R2MMX4_LINAN
DPPQCNTWAGQCALYILVMVFEKIVITLLVQFSFWDKVRDVILSPIKDPHLELIIVMFVVPLIVNAIMFWVIDNFLMMKKLKLKAFSTPVDSPGASVRYFSASNRVKYYDKPERADNSDSDEPLDLQDDSSDTEIRMNGSPLRDRHYSESLETNRLI